MKNHYTLLNQSKNKKIPFSIEIQEHHSDIDTHTHDCVELVVILSGRAEHSIDDETYELTAGDVFVVSKNSEHGYKSVSKIKYANIMFDYQNLTENLSELMLIPGFQTLFVLEPKFRKEHKFESKLQLDSVSLGFVKELLNILLKEYVENNRGQEFAISTYFLTLITYLSRQFDSNQNTASSKLYRLSNAILYLQSNFLEPIHIDDVAAISYLSTRQFARVFKKSFEMSPKEYLIKLRLDYACRLMEQSHKTISEVALESGFSDISFFSRIFKSKIGVSPKIYRKSRII
ncbi:MAG: helix-turn-helix transcriptional regulator [Vallitaleaceae bacterium]|nr:helix-turn-helix transcriptional regulator [Vallitaleaceae bacterium]